MVSSRSKNLDSLNAKIKVNLSTREAGMQESGGSQVKVVDKSNDGVNHRPQFRDIASKNNYLQVTCTIGTFQLVSLHLLLIIGCFFSDN